MPDISLRFDKDIVVVDGAMGTMLIREGAPTDECGMLLNILDPELILSIHQRYKLAGAQAITTNSFGGTRTKLAAYGLEDNLFELNAAAVRLAKQARPEHVLADVGPCGLVMEPLGTASFDEVFKEYAEQIEALASEGPDAILIETMSDIADARCAVLAAKSVCDLPVMVSCTFDMTGHMELSGTDPTTAAVILEAVGADVVGLNCGLGPDQLLPLLREMGKATALPLIIQPNAGLPKLDASGQTVYLGTADDFANAAFAFREAGAQFIGSCCGSNPAFTGAIYGSVSGLDVKPRPPSIFRDKVVLASPMKTVALGAGLSPGIIGERINPTGKPDLSAELEVGKMSFVRRLAESQVKVGATLIDVNVGAPMVDAKEALPEAVRALMGFISCPLVIDTTDFEALRSTLRVYPGRALINSVNGDVESLDALLPLAKTYGAALIALTMDERGIPATVEGRLDIAKSIRKSAHARGLKDQDLLFDVLCMAAASDPAAPETTLKAVRELSERSFATVLGVSNVSHGLPDRPRLNAAFLAAAVDAGLSAAIVNPNDPVMQETLHRIGFDRDSAGIQDAFAEWEAALESAMAKAQDPESRTEPHPQDPALAIEVDLSPDQLLKKSILRGDRDAIPVLIDAVIDAGFAAEGIVDALLAPTLNELGEAFERGEAFLPQLMLAAGAMKVALGRIKEYLPTKDDASSAGKILFCTVKGDVHTIGKDICVALLESQGFTVLDLGVDVPIETIISTARSEDVDVICLSALMTTTLSNMKATVEEIYRVLPEFAAKEHKGVAVGGAVVSERWAQSINASYSANASSCVSLVRSIIKGF